MIRTAFLCLIALAMPSFALTASPYTIEGEWRFFYLASSDEWKLMFAEEGSSHSQMYFYCIPNSNEITAIYSVPDVDIRNYVPEIRSESGVYNDDAKIEFNDVDSYYYVAQTFRPDSPFLRELANGEDISAGESIFPLSAPYDGRIFREFARACSSA
ncbi:hypothetical protein GV829_12115 [Sphingomonas lacunae]|uniref:DUF4384 domain-containing protein n=1 Tax=Sphingomonas lacunae TaxID=2698828 RepID=A0A6M4AXI2_9SPHN|nr:hypothetical protein [Sphingomonas lacunae]QJQ33090.1 hypothetical protein GV829_12115 [Sphingomonas lacunae]